MARLTIGWSGERVSRDQALLADEPVLDRSPGSYEGVLTSARIFPVELERGDRAAPAAEPSCTLPPAPTP